jgi:hypothetical protein
MTLGGSSEGGARPVDVVVDGQSAEPAVEPGEDDVFRANTALGCEPSDPG